MDGLTWRTSSRCVPIANTECVEVADLPDGGKAIRHSQSPEAVQYYTGPEWIAFIAGAKDGEFD